MIAVLWYSALVQIQIQIQIQNQNLSSNTGTKNKGQKIISKIYCLISVQF